MRHRQRVHIDHSDTLDLSQHDQLKLKSSYPSVVNLSILMGTYYRDLFHLHMIEV